MELMDYIDCEQATRKILSDYRDQCWKAEHFKQQLRSADDRMTRLACRLDAVPVQGGGNKSQEMLCREIDKKDAARRGYQQAEAFLQAFEPCWNRLSEEERFLLSARFVDQSEKQGISMIMERYFIGRSEAYSRSTNALKRLARMLFW